MRIGRVATRVDVGDPERDVDAAGRLEELFEAFINLINAAIDDKSPYTGGHCQRVPMLTMMLAEAGAEYGEPMTLYSLG